MRRKQTEYLKLAYITYKNAKICVKCYSTINIVVHHKNNDFTDNKEHNLQILCHRCHIKHHKKGFVPWNKWKKMDLEYREKISIFNKWKIISVEQREKTREALIWNSNKLNKWWKFINWMWLTQWKKLTWLSSTVFYKLAK
jgi:hypothetical protein